MARIFRMQLTSVHVGSVTIYANVQKDHCHDKYAHDIFIHTGTRTEGSVSTWPHAPPQNNYTNTLKMHNPSSNKTLTLRGIHIKLFPSPFIFPLPQQNSGFTVVDEKTVCGLCHFEPNVGNSHALDKSLICYHTTSRAINSNRAHKQ